MWYADSRPHNFSYLHIQIKVVTFSANENGPYAEAVTELVESEFSQTGIFLLVLHNYCTSANNVFI